MSGFEVIVRPVVFPNIRPQPTRSLLPADDPAQGVAVLSGASGQVIALVHSFNASGSMPGGIETQRVFDVARVYPEGSGASGRSGSDGDVYIDVEVLKEVRMTGASGTSVWTYTPIEESDNIEIIERNRTRSS